MKTLRLMRLAITLAALVLSGVATAQYVWLDEKGIRQYSDTQPPASVPKGRILKEPGSPMRPDSAAEPQGAAPAKTPMTTAERNADFKKRQAAQVEKDKKAAEDTRVAAENAAGCERARAYQRSLEAGGRVATTDRSGETQFMTDEQRSRELKDVRRMLDDCK